MYINGRWYTETEVKAYVDKLIEENEELKELREIFAKADIGKATPKDYLDLLNEWAEMKKLLKAAVDDFKTLGTQAEDEYGRCSLNDSVCDYCVLGGGNLADDCQWRYADKALKLIGEDTNIPASATDINVGGKMRVDYEGDGYDDDGNIIYDTAYCPKCRQEYEVDYDNHDNYCRNCGQALDWSMDGGADNENT